MQDVKERVFPTLTPSVCLHIFGRRESDAGLMEFLYIKERLEGLAERKRNTLLE